MFQHRTVSLQRSSFGSLITAKIILVGNSFNSAIKVIIKTIIYSTLIEITDERVNEIIIQAGMTVDASIIGQKRSVIGYVFTPVSKLKRTAFREK